MNNNSNNSIEFTEHDVENIMKILDNNSTDNGIDNEDVNESYKKFMLILAEEQKM
jgi:hypothetical protein